ncbi:hypothetical protein MNBD_GAMMA14-2578 [hydrothermal vent metagenome]|uniref:Uncharacterized protein n=1 Tax=hydrothermal vent metagenome TaxID=652676 RepID=A0A3B0Z3F8_9ZZZZ
MATPTQIIQALIDKLHTLPAERLNEVADFVDFLKQRTRQGKSAVTGKTSLDFPVDDPGPWPEGLSLRREDMYDDDGR